MNLKFFNKDNKLNSDADMIEDINNNTYHIESFLGSKIQKDFIIMWHGNINNKPVGWKLCDGNNNTQNMKNFIPMGADNINFLLGYIYGKSTFIASGDLLIASHILTINEMPQHDHKYLDKYADIGNWMYPSDVWGCSQPYIRILTTTSIGGTQSHTHNQAEGSELLYNEINSMPKYHGVYFLMKE